ncbi:MAG: hypothetical protein ACKVP7_11405 [Hyphomicrobiaceae bacterium]
MHEFFIDDAGELKRLSRYDLEDAKLADNLVQNIGFISVRVKASSIELRLRPKVVTVEALIGLMYWLADTRPTRVILTVWVDNAWRPAIASSREWRAGRICELIKTAEENAAASELHDYLSVRGPTAAIEWPPLLDQRQGGGDCHRHMLQKYTANDD